MYDFEIVPIEEVTNLAYEWDFYDDELDNDVLEEHYATLSVAELFEELLGL